MTGGVKKLSMLQIARMDFGGDCFLHILFIPPLLLHRLGRERDKARKMIVLELTPRCWLSWLAGQSGFKAFKRRMASYSAHLQSSIRQSATNGTNVNVLDEEERLGIICWTALLRTFIMRQASKVLAGRYVRYE